MNPPLHAPGHWIPDQRGQGRGVRVSSHVEAGFLVLSTWKEGTVVSTVRLLPDEAAALIAGIADGLSHLADGPGHLTDGPEHLTEAPTAPAEH